MCMSSEECRATASVSFPSADSSPTSSPSSISNSALPPLSELRSPSHEDTASPASSTLSPLSASPTIIPPVTICGHPATPTYSSNEKEEDAITSSRPGHIADWGWSAPIKPRTEGLPRQHVNFVPGSEPPQTTDLPDSDSLYDAFVARWCFAQGYPSYNGCDGGGIIALERAREGPALHQDPCHRLVELRTARKHGETQSGVSPHFVSPMRFLAVCPGVYYSETENFEPGPLVVGNMDVFALDDISRRERSVLRAGGGQGKKKHAKSDCSSRIPPNGTHVNKLKRRLQWHIRGGQGGSFAAALWRSTDSHVRWAYCNAEESTVIAQDPYRRIPTCQQQLHSVDSHAIDFVLGVSNQQAQNSAKTLTSVAVMRFQSSWTDSLRKVRNNRRPCDCSVLHSARHGGPHIREMARKRALGLHVALVPRTRAWGPSACSVGDSNRSRFELGVYADADSLHNARYLTPSFLHDGNPFRECKAQVGTQRRWQYLIVSQVVNRDDDNIVPWLLQAVKMF
ncbi:hypothetical protein HD554DRAFT_2249957 [Boletus coccyginus]|nr:hypothetical protein HD554DRAFT_2249957 [Boletus coccyginus]